APGQPGQQGQPPFGSSPATQPTKNAGYEAVAQKRVALILDGIAETIPLAGPSSELGIALTEAMRKLAKFAQPGAVTPAGKQNALRSAMTRNQQQGALMQQLKQQAASGGGGAPQGAMPQGGQA